MFLKIYQINRKDMNYEYKINMKKFKLEVYKMKISKLNKMSKPYF